MAKAVSLEVKYKGRRYKDAEAVWKEASKELGKEWDGAAKDVSRELRDILQDVIRSVAAQHGTPWPDGTTQTTLSSRSGRLVRALLRSVKVKGSTVNTIEAEIRLTGYAPIHEFGGTITPKRGKFLTIPLPAALDGQGVPKMRRARDWPNTFVAKTKKGNLVIFQRRGAEIIPLYVLKTSVTIPPRLGVREAVNKKLPYFRSRLADRLVKAVEKKGN